MGLRDVLIAIAAEWPWGLAVLAVAGLFATSFLTVLGAAAIADAVRQAASPRKGRHRAPAPAPPLDEDGETTPDDAATAEPDDEPEPEPDTDETAGPADPPTLALRTELTQ